MHRSQIQCPVFCTELDKAIHTVYHKTYAVIADNKFEKLIPTMDQFFISMRREMKLTDAKTYDEVSRAVGKNYPDEIEFEPGKIARFDPDSGVWIYTAPDGTSLVITL